MQERIIVLKMVQDGDINVEEAVKLLHALNNTRLTPKQEFERSVQKISNNIDSFAKDFKNKIQKMAKNDPLKVKGNAEQLINKAGEMFEDFTNSISGLFNINKSCEDKNDAFSDAFKEDNFSDFSDDE